MDTFETCPLGNSRKRRSIDYDSYDLYGSSHDSSSSSDDFIDAHYDEMEQRYEEWKERNGNPRNRSSNFTTSERVLNGETGTLPFFVAIRTSTNIHFCGGARTIP